MSIALDIGTHALRSLRRDGERLLARRMRGAFAQLPESEGSQRLLGESDVPTLYHDGRLLVLGESAEELARRFGMPLMPLLPQGELPPHDSLRRQIVGLVIERLLPDPRLPGEVCCMTLPDPSAGDGRVHRERNDLLRRLVQLRGYTPIVFSAATAIVLAELVDRRFTGIGMAWGAAGCETTLVHCGRELRRRFVPLGGHRIDAELARRHFRSRSSIWSDVRDERTLASAIPRTPVPSFSGGEGREPRTFPRQPGTRLRPGGPDRRASSGDAPPTLDEIRRWKETLGGEAAQRDPRLAEVYGRLLREVIADVATFLSAAPEVGLLPQPMAVVAGGGPTRFSGFRDQFLQALSETEFPLDVDEFRLAEPSENLVARGCLIRSELEEQASAGPRRAA